MTFERALLANNSAEHRRWAKLPPEEYEESLLSICTPDFEFGSRAAQVEGAGTYRGLEGMLAYREDMLSALEEWEVLDPRCRELDSGAVAGTWRFRARGRDSGILIDMRIGGVAEFREGRDLQARRLRHRRRSRGGRRPSGRRTLMTEREQSVRRGVPIQRLRGPAPSRGGVGGRAAGVFDSYFHPELEFTSRLLAVEGGESYRGF